MVAYMSAFGTSPDQVTPDYKQNGINITFPADAPTGYAPGDHVKFDVSGWSMTNPADTKDTAIVVKVGATTLSCACTLDNTPQPALPGSDVTGKASIDVVVPASTLPGPLTLSLSGAATGTESQVTVTAIKAGTTSVTAADFAVEYGQAAQVQVTVSGPGLTPTGTVDLKDGSTVVASGTLDGTGKATITVPALTYPVGQVTLTAAYSGDAQHDASTKSLTFTTTKAASTTSAADGSMEYGKPADVTVNVGAAAGVDVSGTVTVKDGATTVGTAPVVAGVATVTLAAKSLEVGAASLTASYSGNANVQVSDTRSRSRSTRPPRWSWRPTWPCPRVAPAASPSRSPRSGSTRPARSP
jgi:5'-nucleotidase